MTFDEVRVPMVNRVGAENEGWGIAKHLMRFARSNNTNSSLLRSAWRAAEREAASTEPALAMRLAEIETELAAFESLEMRLLASGRLSGDDEAGSSLMKVAATELHQRIAELLLDAAGPYNGASSGSYPLRKYFSTRAASIYSGTNEIHRNVIGKHLLHFAGDRFAASKSA